MCSDKGFAPIIILIIIAITVIGGGSLYYQSQKSIPHTQFQKSLQSISKDGEKIEAVSQEIIIEKPKKESVIKQEIKPKPAPLPLPSQT